MTQKLKEQGHGIGWEMSAAVMGLRQMGQSEASLSVMVDCKKCGFQIIITSNYKG